tara:strand:- start:876 stop:1538 length:663 start_codon:yes stop_codon:yes gene_type:complete
MINKQITKKQLLSIRIVLDRSGSMTYGRDLTIEALNTYLKELKKDKDINASLTLSTFDSLSIDIPISRTPLSKIKSFSKELLQPRGGTPLFDAIGLAIYDLENNHDSKDENKVLVIVTDGLENASKEYTYKEIELKIKEKEDLGWLIIYLGADHDSFKQSSLINIDRKRSMRYSKRDSVDAFKAVTRTTLEYDKGTRNKDIFFTNEERMFSNKFGYGEEE